MCYVKLFLMFSDEKNRRNFNKHGYAISSGYRCKNAPWMNKLTKKIQAVSVNYFVLIGPVLSCEKK